MTQCLSLKSLRRYSFRTAFLTALFCSLFTLSSPLHATALHVGTDPRIELLTTVQLLSGYPFLTPHQTHYARVVFKRFSSHVSHPAVRHFRSLSASTGWSDAYPTAMLYLSDPPELEEIFPPPPPIYAAFNGPENFDRFVSALRSFAHQTRFMHFYHSQEDFFGELEQGVRGLIGDHDPISTVESYYGIRQVSYHLILSPLLHHGGFGPHIGRPGGPYDVYTVLGPTRAQYGIPSYGPRPHLLELIWHEFGHAFANDLAGTYSEELLQRSALYLPLSKPMRNMGYTRWIDCANEHVIRAVTARLSTQVFSPEQGRQALREDAERGFRYVHAISRRLVEYEQNRTTYPNFSHFYPRIIETFGELDRPKRPRPPVDEKTRPERD